MSDHLCNDSLMQCVGCPTKLSDNMAIAGFLLIIFTNLKFPLGLASLYLIYVKKLQALKNIQIQVHLCFYPLAAANVMKIKFKPGACHCRV